MQLIPSDEFVVVDADILCFGATDGKTEKQTRTPINKKKILAKYTVL